MTAIEQSLTSLFSENGVLTGEPVKNHTTLKVGGPADYFIQPQTASQLSLAVRACRVCGVPFFVLGNGSNVLCLDGGFRGVIISTVRLNSLELLEGNLIKAGSGALMKDVSDFALFHSLTGFEFACGIPGTIGGGAFMNAGAYEGELRDVFHSAGVIDENGEMEELIGGGGEFGYRKSPFQKNNLIVADVTVKLHKGDYDEIKVKIDSLNQRREEKQPLEMPSAGSTFKRPPGRFAGKLIMDCGLRGFAIGGAQVSEKHCGFVVNKGNATAKDILRLIAHIKKTVMDRYGVELEPEIRVIGE